MMLLLRELETTLISLENLWPLLILHRSLNARTMLISSLVLQLHWGIEIYPRLTCSSATIVHLLFASYHTTYRYFSFGTLVVIIVIVTRSITNSKFTSWNPTAICHSSCQKLPDTCKLVSHISPTTAYRFSCYAPQAPCVPFRQITLTRPVVIVNESTHNTI